MSGEAKAIDNGEDDSSMRCAFRSKGRSGSGKTKRQKNRELKRERATGGHTKRVCVGCDFEGQATSEHICVTVPQLRAIIGVRAVTRRPDSTMLRRRPNAMGRV
jgi:hypothetical protein